ncbi:MAG: hypothetical protein KIT14_22110 [bacterium]|nr:hypothetical protein [bacterium]
MRRSLLAPLVLGALLAHDASAAPGVCPTYALRARRVGSVPEALRELSGLAASRRHPGIYWAHNDSGNALALHAIREDGRIVATFPIPGVKSRDPEDVAVGPCDATRSAWCIYLADIGDNGQRRAGVQLLKLREPAELRNQPLRAEVLPFTYAEGPRNAEAILVDPRTARVFVISKVLASLGDVFRVDGLGSRAGGTAVRVRRLRAPNEFDSYTTAAAVHPDGERVLLRTYGRVWELRSPGARAFEDVLDATPVAVTSASQPQAEAISYTSDGRGYLLGSEGVGAPLYLVECAER